jgi:dienelactone hydrolase
MIKNYQIISLLLVFTLNAQAQTSEERRKQYLRESLLINQPADHRHPISRRLTIQDSTWMDWQKRTGELPPDFEQMPSYPFLPDPLVIEKNGRKHEIKTKDEWEQRRSWIKEQYQYWVSGKRPPAPADFKVKVLEERQDGSTKVQMIELAFGPGYKAKMTFELMVPEGKGPFPVYMTQWTHRNWAQLALRRGYVACVYAGADGKDDTQDYQSLYPEYDFGALMRRAWGASRVIDYLVTRKEINPKQIAITGHSRNGKQALWAGAFDDRIAAVVSSSCGTGGITPFRMSDPQYVNQTLDDITSNAAHWFHPRLRFFFGREDKLPVDQNLLVALMAPRHILFHYATVEQQLNPWVNEQTYHSARKVFTLMGVENNIALSARMGEHAVAARDVEKCIDFLDASFKRNNIPWNTTLNFDYDFEKWATDHASEKKDALSIEPVYFKSYEDPGKRKEQDNKIKERIDWLLGKEPSGVKPSIVAPTDPSRIDWIDRITGRPVVKNTKTEYFGPYTAIGDHLPATIYYPTDAAGNKKTGANGKIPVVIYLHEYAYAHGFAHGYSPERQGNSRLFQSLTDKGFAVMAIDLFGFGTRMEEAQHFYSRYPEWSKMGKMVSDTRACIDALESFENIDKERIFLLGNTLGGQVALFTAAKDSRVSGLVTVAAFSPLRASDSRYESIRTLSHSHGLLPRLGWYAEKPANSILDYPELISRIAPRPLLIFAPVLDRYTNISAVKESHSTAKTAYQMHGKPENLQAEFPVDINRISESFYNRITTFFNSIPAKGNSN